MAPTAQTPSEATFNVVTGQIALQLGAMLTMIPEDRDEADEVIDKMHGTFVRKMVRRVIYGVFEDVKFSLPRTYFKSGAGRRLLMEALGIVERMNELEEKLDNSSGHYDSNDNWVEDEKYPQLTSMLLDAQEDLTLLSRKIAKEGFKR